MLPLALGEKPVYEVTCLQQRDAKGRVYYIIYVAQV